jgi:hypothetical protein
MIALACFALALALGVARYAQAQDAKNPYPNDSHRAALWARMSYLANQLWLQIIEMIIKR